MYRHLLFNRLGRADNSIDPSVIRLGILLLLFDVYLTWARIEKASASPSHSSGPDPPSLGGIPSAAGEQDVASSFVHSTSAETRIAAEGTFLSRQPILAQYLFFLALCTLETLSFHLPILALLSCPRPSLPPSISRFTRHLRTLIPYYPHPLPTSTALLVSSSTKLFPLLLQIWTYDLSLSSSAVSWAVIINNVAALQILLDCGWLQAGLVAAVGAIGRAAVGWAMLMTVGVVGEGAVRGVVETGDLVGLGREVGAWMGWVSEERT